MKTKMNGTTAFTVGLKIRLGFAERDEPNMKWLCGVSMLFFVGVFLTFSFAGCTSKPSCDSAAAKDAELCTERGSSSTAPGSDEGNATVEGSGDAGSTDGGSTADGGSGTGDGETDGGAGDGSSPLTCFDHAEPVPESPLEGETMGGRTETTTADGFTDHYLYDTDDYLKIGLREEWGGSIIFFGLSDGSPGMNANNTIDANDTGREVQVALYDPDRVRQGCAHDASCALDYGSCPASITYLGWNPVQGGNRCNNGSGVDSVSASSGALTITTTPLHWNPNWDFTSCDSGGCSDPSLSTRRSDVRLTQTLRFVRTHVVELTYKVENLADISHASMQQELPTLYASNGNGGPNLRRLIQSDGTEVSIDEATSGDGFFFRNFSSPHEWVTLQNDALEYGVGLLQENGLSEFQAWQHTEVPFNNVRARFEFGLPALGTVYGRAYLLIGGLGTVSSEAEAVMASLPPFGALEATTGETDASGGVVLAGYALDNRGVVSVEARVDETHSVPLSYGHERIDVCLQWPGYPGCNSVGFSGVVEAELLGGGAECGHLVEIIATDSDGHSRVIDRKLVPGLG
jgi:hypothetical protein